MRDFFVNSLEKLITVIVVLLLLGVVAAAASAAFGDFNGRGPSLLAGISILIAGGLYTILVGGFLYMGVGIYHNTKRTADAVEKLASH